MASKKTRILGVEVAPKTPRGDKMKTGKGWRLASPTGRPFKASLIKRVKIGGEIVAIFRVLPNPE